MKIVVTGGAGFIGSHLVDRLIKEKQKVIIIDNLSTGNKKNFDPDYFKGANSKAKFYKLDIRSSKIAEVFKKEKPQAVFHLAAQIDLKKSLEDPVDDAEINILGSLNIIENFIKNLSRKNSHNKFIFASTGGAVYNDASVIPTPENYPEFSLSPYGNGKLTIDKYLDYYCQVFALPYASLRFANVYGPRQNSKGEGAVIAIFSDKMLSNGQPFINGLGKQTRDFVYVKDVVDSFLLALKKDKNGVFNIGTGKETNINTLFRKLRKLTGSKCKKIHKTESGGEKRSCLDYSKARKELGWRPKYSLDRGLEETVEWFRENV